MSDPHLSLEERLRAQLALLAEEAQAAPDPLGRLAARRRARRRCGVARDALAACLALALVVALARALPAGGPAHELGGPLTGGGGPPRSTVSGIPYGVRAGGRLLLVEALVRVDAASGRQLQVLSDGAHGVVDGWQLLDDGSVVANTVPGSQLSSGCGHRFEQRRADGRWVDLGIAPRTGFGGEGARSPGSGFTFSPDGRLLAVAGQPCPGFGVAAQTRVTVYQVARKVDRRPLAEVRLAVPATPLWLSFSSDSRRIAVTSMSAVFVVDLGDRHPTARIISRSPWSWCLYRGGWFGADPGKLLVAQQECQPRRPAPAPAAGTTTRLAELDLASGRWHSLPQLGDHVDHIDLDASRRYLLVSNAAAVVTYARPEPPRGALPGAQVYGIRIVRVDAWDLLTLQHLSKPAVVTGAVTGAGVCCGLFFKNPHLGSLQW